eukprot:TRINITY_DN33626_c0_g1_i2.p1 TRINITY_DN33626_c0_g1~~TRINITY_DN33626_c0_g1_i2.p1  ORF type:complete len:211 (-),score=41.20 TRINITY_DN33626_c0_g1_i2:173-805(-)
MCIRDRVCDNRAVLRERVAIYGGSWGGYMALSAMTTPDPGVRYRCGVAVVPLSSVGCAGQGLGFRSDPLVSMYWDDVFGECANDIRMAEAVSPLFHVNKVKRPVLLVHGSKDPRVPVAHSEQMAREMFQNGINGSFVTFPDEGHGVGKESNLLAYRSDLERYLCAMLELPPPPAVAIGAGTSRQVLWDESGVLAGGRVAAPVEWELRWSD